MDRTVEMTDREKELGARATAVVLEGMLVRATAAALDPRDPARQARAATARDILRVKRDQARSEETKFSLRGR